jgi:hypothetical protein
MTFRRRLIALGLLFSLTAAAAAAAPASGEEKTCWSKDGVEIIYDASKIAGNNNIDEVCKKMCESLRLEEEGSKIKIENNNGKNTDAGNMFSRNGETTTKLHSEVVECLKSIYSPGQNKKLNLTIDYLNLLRNDTNKAVFYRISTPSPVGAGGQSSPTTSAAPPVNGDSAVNSNQGAHGDTAIRGSTIEKAKNPVAVELQTPDRQPTPEQLIVTAFGMAFLILLIANLWIRYQEFLLMKKIADDFRQFRENDIAYRINNNIINKNNNVTLLLAVQDFLFYMKDALNIIIQNVNKEDDAKNKTDTIEGSGVSQSDEKSSDNIIEHYNKVFGSLDGDKIFFDQYNPILVCRTSADPYISYGFGEITCREVQLIGDSHFWLIKIDQDNLYRLFLSESTLRRSGGLIALGGQRTAQTLFGDLFDFEDGGPNAPVRLLRPASVSWWPEKGVLKVATPGLLSLPVNGDARP